MGRYSKFFAGLVWVLGAGCGGSGGASIEIQIHSPPPLDSTGHCPEDAPATPLAHGAEGPTTLRLTYRRTGGSLVCDAVIALDAPRRLVGVPEGSEDLPALDVVVEAFRGDVSTGATLVGSGAAHALDLRAGGTAQVLVAPRDRFACTPRPSLQGRAFHTATTLPDGRVLLVGGLVPDPADASKTEIRLDQPLTGGGFYASRAVELYDPESGAFTALDVPDLTPRAFHAAYVVPGGAGEAPRVLLVGGLAPSGDAAAAPVADGVRDAAEPLRLVPTADAVAAPTEVLTLLADGAATVARLDPPAAFTPRLLAASTRAPSPGDESATPPPAPLIVGGYLSYPAQFDGTFEAADLDTPTRVGMDTWKLVPEARVGATVTWIGADRALVWGGSLGSPLGQESADAGNLLAGFAASAPMSTKVSFAATGLTPAARAFHAAVVLGQDDLLVVGGFRVAGGAAGDPVAPFAERVRFPDGNGVASVSPVDAASAVPVGYLDATPLPGGGVLVSGGSPALGTDAAPCPDGTANFGLCTIAAAWRWNGTDALEATTPLLAARWGHRSTVLLDGSVLVTGGFTNVGARLYVVRAAELYNPRTEARDAAADSLGTGATRLPGDVARGADGQPIAPCSVVELP